MEPIGIFCNIAHYAIDLLIEQIGLPFYNLLDFDVNEFKKKSHYCEKSLNHYLLFSGVVQYLVNNKMSLVVQMLIGPLGVNLYLIY